MTATIAMSGPPIALVYQHAEGPLLRSTLNMYFGLGSAMSIPALAWAGHFGTTETINGLLLLPATALGFAASGATHGYLDRGRTRSAVLAVASVSALAVVVKTLLA